MFNWFKTGGGILAGAVMVAAGIGPCRGLQGSKGAAILDYPDGRDITGIGFV